MNRKTKGLVFTIVLLLGFASCKPPEEAVLKEPVTGMEFVRIKKGRFLMGDPEERRDSELLHEVFITKDYWLGKTEVTQAQWNRVMGKRELHPEKPSPFRTLNPDYPMVSISYVDIENFLDSLNTLSTEYRFRLPTEAEWEYACRAGTNTVFSFGNRIDDNLANYNGEVPSAYSASQTYHSSPKPVGSYPPNPWGLYDTHGNVWEWVVDWYAPYSSESVTNPTGPPMGDEKVLRGGSWYFGAEQARSSARRSHAPELWGFSIGFRLVCERK